MSEHRTEEAYVPSFSSGGLPDELSVAGVRVTRPELTRMDRFLATFYADAEPTDAQVERIARDMEAA